jgi:hypothetical protein
MQAVMDHIVLNAEDVGVLVQFYTEVVELEPERLNEFHGGKVPFPSVRVNAGTVIDLAPRAMWENVQLRTRGRPNLNHFCLTLEKVGTSCGNVWPRDRLLSKVQSLAGVLAATASLSIFMILKGMRSKRGIMENEKPGSKGMMWKSSLDRSASEKRQHLAG